MRSLTVIMLLCAVVILGPATALADSTYHVAFSFEENWSGDYADGWQNTGYRHGDPPIGKMMQYVQFSDGNGAMKLVVDSVATANQFWAGVNPEGINAQAMLKQYNPWVSVRYYDQGTSDLRQVAGQLFALPEWTNPYLPGGEDWTDIQFGGRRDPGMENYWHIESGENMPGWVNTGVARSAPYVDLKMQLSNADGKVHFFINGVEVGESYRNDYADLGTVGLYTMFTAPLSAWDEKPYTLWDNFEFGSSAIVPAPAALVLGMLGLGLVGWTKRRLGA